MPLAALLLPAAALCPQAPSPLHLPLDAPDATWHGATPVGDGAVGGAAHFDGEQARIDAGPCPVPAQQAFTLRCRLRTTRGTFCTPLMARDGERVGLSLVLGRAPGKVSFEAWSWQSVRLLSSTRVDDGNWHAIEVAYEPRADTALLCVDGRIEASGQLGDGGSPAATLRLGDNLGAHQPFLGDLDEVELLRAAAHADAFALAVPVLPLAERQAALAGLRQRLLPRATPSLEPPALDAWDRRRAAVRAHVRDCLGLTPEPARGPLDVQVHGSLQQDGLVVERLSFCAFPGRRATGWLWRPAARPAGRNPAVLCPHGHWEHGARDPVVQARCAAFARFGWVALATDSSHAEAVAAGASPIGTMTWQNLRALDLLAARDDVDPARIAVTGCSGGAQQTCYLMATSDAIAAAAPVCMACYFAEIVADQSAHCRCNHLPRLACGTDVPELCATFAPRPAFFGSVTGDWTHAFPQQGLPELQQLWRQLGRPDALQSLHRDEGHDYSRPMRERVYGFFQDAFAGRLAAAPRAVPEPPFAPFLPAALAALGGPPADQLADDAFVARELLARRPRLDDLRALAPALPWRVVPRPIEWRGGAELRWRPGVVRGDDRVGVPLLLGRSDAADPEPWTVVAAGAGKAAVLLGAPRWLAAARRPVFVDPRFLGEWQPFAAAWRRNGILLGMGELYQGAHDLALVCESLPGSAPVTLVGLGEAGCTALAAAALSPRVSRLLADDLGVSYEERPDRAPLAPELLRAGGLPALLQRLQGRCACVLGGAQPGGWPAWADLRPPLDGEALAQQLLARAR